MNDIIGNQDVLVYVVDADTKQIIRENFKYNGYTSEMDGPETIWSVIFGGTMIEKRTVYWGNEGAFTLNFNESQITEFGYDYNSITENEIKATYDPELNAYLYPSVAVIYMSKLK